MDPQPYSEKTDFRHPQQRGATQAQLLPAELLEEALAASHAAGELPRYANNEMISGVTPAHHAGAVAPPYWEKRMLFSLFGVRVRSVVSLTTGIPRICRPSPGHLVPSADGPTIIRDLRRPYSRGTPPKLRESACPIAGGAKTRPSRAAIVLNSASLTTCRLAPHRQPDLR